MSVDYSRQYERSQLEPFFPNEMVKMLVSVLAMLAVIVVVALLVPEAAEEPADPRATPAHIKPEWYFLATYQSLKLMPQEFLGISGKLLGVLVQTAAFAVLVTVPFWYRKVGRRAPRFWTAITFAIAMYVTLTLLGVWPEDSQGRLAGAAEFLHEHGMMVSAFGIVLAFFYFMLWWERLVIRRRWHE